MSPVEYGPHIIPHAAVLQASTDQAGSDTIEGQNFTCCRYVMSYLFYSIHVKMCSLDYHPAIQTKLRGVDAKRETIKIQAELAGE